MEVSLSSKVVVLGGGELGQFADYLSTWTWPYRIL